MPPRLLASSAPFSVHGYWFAWLLFPFWLVSRLVFPFALCYYVTCPTCMRSASSPHDYCTCMFSAFDACSFCSALDFCCAYIRLVKHVCFASLYQHPWMAAFLVGLTLGLRPVGEGVSDIKILLIAIATCIGLSMSFHLLLSCRSFMDFCECFPAI